MKKHRDEYDSPLDALITLAKRLSLNENQYHMSSEDFFDSFQRESLRTLLILLSGPMIINIT